MLGSKDLPRKWGRGLLRLSELEVVWASFAKPWCSQFFTSLWLQAMCIFTPSVATIPLMAGAGFERQALCLGRSSNHFTDLHTCFATSRIKRLFTPVRNSDVSGCRPFQQLVILLLSFLLLCFTAGFWVVARFLVWFLVQAVKSDGGFGYVGIAASFRRIQKCIVLQHCDSGLNRPGSDLPSPFRDESRLAVASTESKWGPVNFSIFQPHHPWSPRVIYVTDLGQDGFFCRYHPIFNFCQCILMIDVHLVFFFNCFFSLILPSMSCPPYRNNSNSRWPRFVKFVEYVNCSVMRDHFPCLGWGAAFSHDLWCCQAGWVWGSVKPGPAKVQEGNYWSNL